MTERDRLFAAPSAEGQAFVFDERVVQVFPDMINRSVPGYALIVPLMALLARRYAQDGTHLYDLGCSLGAVALAMSDVVQAQNARIIAVDKSPAMIAELKRLLASGAASGRTPIVPRCEDVLATDMEQASVVAMNFTLQFVDPAQRSVLMRKIHDGLLPGGALLLSEKVRFETGEEEALQTAWHHDFKRAQGYSELEIARKRDALENVLHTETLARHRQRLLEAGFSRVYQWFQGLGFVSLIALK
jgi:tRNA (cmo5U34)-methyltransferase